MPSPSSEPETTTEIVDTRKPVQMMRSAIVPMAMVSLLVLNNPISCSDKTRQSSVPAAIMAAHMAMAVR